MTKKEKKKIDNTSLNLCKNIKNNVSLLSQNELNEIFKILHKNDSKYTKNNNGVFVNLNWLDNDILVDLINNYINFCIKSNKEIKKHEIMKNIYNENMNKKKITILLLKILKKKHQKKQNVIDVEKTNKISSSMKFYLFKKKFQKSY